MRTYYSVPNLSTPQCIADQHKREIINSVSDPEGVPIVEGVVEVAVDTDLKIRLKRYRQYVTLESTVG